MKPIRLNRLASGWRSRKRHNMKHDPFDRSRKVQILLSDSQNSRLARAAKRSGVTKSAFLRVALERELDLDDQLDLEIKNKPAPPVREKRVDRRQMSLF